MQLKLSLRYVLTFLLLVLVMLELHETVHIITGRIICGTWGTRDFNVWRLCEDCEKAHPLSWIATLAGPLFSFMMMWLGAWFLYSKSTGNQLFGFALVFADIPFGRISQAMMGSGDEMMVARHLLHTQFSHTQIVIVCSVILLVAGLPPIVMAYRYIKNKYAWLYLLGFLTLPLVFIMGYVLTFLNYLLAKGLLSSVWIMGTPLLITVHTIAALILLLFARKCLVLGG
jgi:hypothetical protein